MIGNSSKWNDKHIFFAQCLLMSQFKNIAGFKCTLLQPRLKLDCSKDLVQILHICGGHWIVISNIHTMKTRLYVYDTVYSTVSEETKKIISGMIKNDVRIDVYPGLQKQIGGADCGVFAIAIATSLSWYGSYYF